MRTSAQAAVTNMLASKRKGDEVEFFHFLLLKLAGFNQRREDESLNSNYRVYIFVLIRQHYPRPHAENALKGVVFPWCFRRKMRVNSQRRVPSCLRIDPFRPSNAALTAARFPWPNAEVAIPRRPHYLSGRRHYTSSREARGSQLGG